MPAEQDISSRDLTHAARVKLDTSGFVLSPPGPTWPVKQVWSDLSPFEQGYVEAMMADGDKRCQSSAYTRFASLSPEALARIRKDCDVFLTENAESLSTATPNKLRDAGAWWWSQLDLTPYLADDGRVNLKEGV